MYYIPCKVRTFFLTSSFSFVDDVPFAGLTSLHVQFIPIYHTLWSRIPPRWLRRPTPLIPSSLRHLSFSCVELRRISSPIPHSLWPELIQLSSLHLNDLRCVDEQGQVQQVTTLAVIRLLLERCAPTLQALHYSCGVRVFPTRPKEDGIAVLHDIPLPSLRILSISVLFFHPCLVSTTPNLTHLFICLDDMSTLSLTPTQRYTPIGVVYDRLIAIFSPSTGFPAKAAKDGTRDETENRPAWTQLVAVEIPQWVGFEESKLASGLHVEVEKKRLAAMVTARTRGIEGRTALRGNVPWFLEQTDDRFKRALRQILKEKV
jgi:hypothetical protein